MKERLMATMPALPAQGPDDGHPSRRVPGLPAALLKACARPSDYALGLSTGHVLYFESATLSEDGLWLHVEPHEGEHGVAYTHPDNQVWPMRGVPYSFARGLDVRVSAIIWIADAPRGS
jgi:hypothetical protein